jgi:hypothetical protein
VDGTIECWLGNLVRGTSHSDYWRASPDGLFYIVRGYEDDETGSLAGRTGGEPGETLDVVLPIWRLSEALIHAQRMGGALGQPDSSVTFMARWHGLRDRKLAAWSSPNRAPFWNDYVSRQSTVTSSVEERAANILDNLPDLVGKLVAPLYEVFSFWAAPPELIEAEVAKVVKYERSD